METSQNLIKMMCSEVNIDSKDEQGRSFGFEIYLPEINSYVMAMDK